MEPDARSDEQLMAAYLAGDAGAFEALYRRLQPWLLRLVAAQLSAPEEAQDLAQQAFLQLHQARFDFLPGSRLRPWLATIALNLKRGWFRRRRRRPERPLTDETLGGRESPSATPEEAAAAAQLRRALETLAAHEREVIVLHYYGGFSFAEIGEMTGTSLSAVKQRARRGYAHLRKRLEGRA